MNTVAVVEVTALTAFQLSEERACAGYLAARKVVVGRARRVAVVESLTRADPGRVDYRLELDRAVTAHAEASAREHAAWLAWQRAQYRTDREWADTTGRVTVFS
jgi:hypothetical protein